MSKNKNLGFLLAALLFSGSAFASDVTTNEANFKVISFSDKLIINKNNGYTMQVQRVVMPLNATGVQSVSQINIKYPGSFAKLKILDAYTQDPDGTRHKVVPSEVFKQSTHSAIAAPFLSDGVNVSVIFPSVSPGDSLHIKYDIDYEHPYLPGIYALSATLYPSNFVKISDIKMSSVNPAYKKFYQSKYGDQWIAGENSFSGSMLKVAVPPLGSPDPTQYASTAVMSTANNWKELANAYSQVAKPSMLITPEIHSLAIKIVDGKTGAQAITKIFHWIQNHIHGVSVDYMTAGFKPISAADTLSRGVGDSNAKVVLMCAMLHSLGIQAVPALLSQSERFKPYPGVDPFAFDHFIVYLPEIHRFMDVSYRLASANALPIQDAGRPVLITGENPQMTVTPSPDISVPLMSKIDNFNLNGTILTGTEKTVTDGYMALNSRSSFSGLKGARLLRSIKNNFYEHGGVGEIHSVSFLNRKNLDEPFGVLLHVTRTDGSTPGKIYPIALPDMHKISSALSPFIGSATRSTPSFTNPVSLSFVLKIKVPTDYHPLFLPKSEEFTSPVGNYKVSYAFKDNTFTEYKTLILKHFIISPGDFAALHKIATLAIESSHNALVLEKST